MPQQQKHVHTPAQIYIHIDIDIHTHIHNHWWIGPYTKKASIWIKQPIQSIYAHNRKISKINDKASGWSWWTEDNIKPITRSNHHHLEFAKPENQEKSDRKRYYRIRCPLNFTSFFFMSSPRLILPVALKSIFDDGMTILGGESWKVWNLSGTNVHSNVQRWTISPQSKNSSSQPNVHGRLGGLNFTKVWPISNISVGLDPLSGISVRSDSQSPKC